MTVEALNPSNKPNEVVKRIKELFGDEIKDLHADVEKEVEENKVLKFFNKIFKSKNGETMTDKLKKLFGIEETTDINTENIEQNIIANKDKIIQELAKYQSPITFDDIAEVVKKPVYKNVKRERIMAVMKNDSSYGTAGVGARTNNPGNVGNTDDGSTKNFASRKDGIDAVAKNLQERYNDFKKQYTNKEPTIEQLLSNKWPDGKWFFKNFNKGKENDYRVENGVTKSPVWAYMTAQNGPKKVQEYTDELVA